MSWNAWVFKYKFKIGQGGGMPLSLCCSVPNSLNRKACNKGMNECMNLHSCTLSMRTSVLHDRCRYEQTCKPKSPQNPREMKLQSYTTFMKDTYHEAYMHMPPGNAGVNMNMLICRSGFSRAMHDYQITLQPSMRQHLEMTSMWMTKRSRLLAVAKTWNNFSPLWSTLLCRA